MYHPKNYPRMCGGLQMQTRPHPDLQRVRLAFGAGAPRKCRQPIVGQNADAKPVYHFVYHCSREFGLASVSTLLEQKQNPLI
jgi:hypothetical protein